MSEGENDNKNTSVTKYKNKSDEKEALSNKKDPYEKYKKVPWDDKEFQNGPLGDENRVCRDCICCIIFVVFLLSCIYVGVFSFQNGDPNLLLYPYDEDGNQCGRKELLDYPYLYYYKAKDNLNKIITKHDINSFCLKECPSEDFNEDLTSDTFECHPTTENTDCTISKKNYFKSKKFLNRFCLPTFKEDENYDPTQNPDNIIIGPDGEKYIKIDNLETEDADGSANSLFNFAFFKNKIGAWISDISNSKLPIGLSAIWSLVFCMIFMLFIRCCSAIIIYTIILLILVVLTVLGVFLKLKANKYEDLGDNKYKKVFDALAYTCWALAAIWLLFILCMCNKIRLAVALLEATGKYISQNCSIAFIPFLFFIITVLWFAYWVLCTLYLISSGTVEGKSDIIPDISFSKKLRYLWWYHFFSLLYMNEFIKAYSQFVYASSASIWYFNYEKGTEPHNILKSFKRGFRYHCGSLAFGALIVAIIKFIMFFMEKIKKKVEKAAGNGKAGKCYKCLLNCCQCCLNCVARTIEFINKHAYIQIALRGKNFCLSAFEGFGLLIRNLGRFSTLILLGSFFSLFGTIFIGVASGVVGYFVITNVNPYKSELDSPIAPTLIMAVIGLVIGNVSMSVFGMSADALMHSFLLDEEVNKGQAKAYPDLAKFMSDER